MISRREPSRGPLRVREHAGQVVPLRLRHRQFEKGPAEHVVARPAECFLGRGIHLGDQALVVDDHDAVERGAQNCVLASFAGGQRSLGALARGDVDHRGDDRDDVAARIPDRCRRRADVDRRAVTVHPAQVEVADHLALRDAREGGQKLLMLAFRDDRTDPADHLLGRPAEDLARSCIPRAHPAVDAEVDDRHR